MGGQGSLLPNLSRQIQSNNVLNPISNLGSKRLNQASIDAFNLYGGNTPEPPAPPAPPVVEQPSPATPLPAIGDQQMEVARRKAMQDQTAKRGRASTIFTSDSGDKLGA